MGLFKTDDYAKVQAFFQDRLPRDAALYNEFHARLVKLAKDFLTNAPPFILVLPTSELTNWPATDGKQFRVRGLDMVKFKNRDLTAIVRDATP